MNRRRHIAIIAVALMALLSSYTVANNWGLPHDKEKISRQVIEVDFDCDSLLEKGTPGLLDLRDALTVGDIEYTYRMYGDTLMARCHGSAREWFTITPDTIRYLGSNSRLAEIEGRKGIDYLVANPTIGCSEINDSTLMRHVSHGMSHNDCDGITHWLSGNKVILAPNDTIECGMLAVIDKTDRIYLNGDTLNLQNRNMRWYSSGEPLPIVECNILSINGGESWQLLTICPPSEQPLAKGGSEKRRLRYDPTKSSDDEAVGNYRQQKMTDYAPASTVVKGDFFTADYDGNLLRIRIDNALIGTNLTDGTDRQETDPAQCRVVISDIAGRVWRSGVGNCDFETEGMPAGVYVIGVTADRTASVKITL